MLTLILKEKAKGDFFQLRSGSRLFFEGQIRSRIRFILEVGYGFFLDGKKRIRVNSARIRNAGKCLVRGDAGFSLGDNTTHNDNVGFYCCTKMCTHVPSGNYDKKVFFSDVSILEF